MKTELRQAGTDVAQELEQSGIRDIVRDLLKSLKPETPTSHLGFNPTTSC